MSPRSPVSVTAAGRRRHPRALRLSAFGLLMAVLALLLSTAPSTVEAGNKITTTTQAAGQLTKDAKATSASAPAAPSLKPTTAVPVDPTTTEKANAAKPTTTVAPVNTQAPEKSTTAAAVKVTTNNKVTTAGPVATTVAVTTAAANQAATPPGGGDPGACVVTIPANALSAKGLSTPWVVSGNGCTQVPDGMPT
ncbi:hypothetical protein M427DRAFT_37318, partial [Gonapodya prolifera JEL478]